VHCVLDSSAALTWVMKDEASEATAALVLNVAEQGALVPVLWKLETANGLLMAECRGRISPADRLRAHAMFDDMPIVLDERTAELAFGPIASLASECRLTVYDACYLELAIRSGLPLASLDAGLCRAASGMGVTLALPNP